MKPETLRTEYLENPLGIDVRRPSLSWWIASDERAVVQGAYQVQAASSPADLEAGNPLWDSGQVASDRSTAVRYEGPEGQSGQRIHWRVRVWDQAGRLSDWSEPAWWEMGLLAEKEWAADWIEVGWDEDPSAFKPCPFFRCSFRVDGAVRSARLYITAHGLYEAWLNGQRVGDQVFTPGFTPYDKRLQYQVYDVTAALRSNENVLGAVLGDGWYRGKVNVQNSRNVYGDRLGLLALLIIDTDDGRRVTVATDSSWKVATGPIEKSDMKEGEIYDARLEMPGWSSPGLNDAAWQSVRVVPHPKHHLVASMGVPVRRKEVLAAKAILHTPKGETVVDFGQNLAGVVRMRVRGPRGTTVRLRHGEALDLDSNFTVGHLFALPKTGKVPTFQEDSYTLKGEGEEEYEPRFTVHGFRYVAVEGYPGDPTPADFDSVAIYSDMPPTGTFSCSDPLLTQLHHNAEWSMKSNFLDIPTDCPTRERAGWAGDAQIFAPSASFLRDTRAFFRKWLQDLVLEQFPDGKVGNFVPNPLRLARGIRAMFLRLLDGSAGWGDAAVLLPWALYRACGDLEVLERQYDSMKAWVDYEVRRAAHVNWPTKLRPRYWLSRTYRARQRLIWDTGYHWGEWLEPGEGSPFQTFSGMVKRWLFGSPVVATAYLANSARILAQTAALLGKAEDARRYEALAARVRAAYAEEFLGPDGRMEPDRQASYVRVLAFDLAPEALRPAIVEHLVRLVRAAGDHVGTGFLSTPFLCHVLADNGRLDVAYDLLMQTTIPSWLYAVRKGATTIWESWDGITEDGKPQLSLNHYSPGAVIDFLHRRVAGLDAAEPGYKCIAIHPGPGGGLTAASAVYESAHGRIASEWVREDGQMRLTVTIPANTWAIVTLPGAAGQPVTESGAALLAAEGVARPVELGNDVQVAIGSGVYRFEYPTA
jgi:alpha-L-rhamnosidase